ncbi:MAG TPA: amidohydrolase, partial [Methanocella sp.]|nr:amidohydrolase [Methanocella sp.]
MSREYIVSGQLIYGDDFEVRDGYVVVSDGKIKEVGFERCEGDMQGLVCPAFVNAHTHLGDSIVKDPPYMPLVDLVAPPNGLKHRVLNAASPAEVAGGMGTALEAMRSTGTCHCIDFR